MSYYASKIVIGLILIAIGIFVFIRSFSMAKEINSQMEKAAKNNDRHSFKMYHQMRTKLRKREWIGIVLILFALFCFMS